MHRRLVARLDVLSLRRGELGVGRGVGRLVGPGHPPPELVEQEAAVAVVVEETPVRLVAPSPV